MIRFAQETGSNRAVARWWAGLLPMVVVPFGVLAATFAMGCGEGDPRCLFGCECRSSADCNDAQECTRDLCADVNGVPMCDHPPEARGLVCNDGGGRVCDGAGTCVECNEASDCPDDGKECTQDLCETVNGIPRCDYPAEERGASCSSGGGRVCDGAGTCVECSQASDCPDDGDVCTVATCEGMSCGERIVSCPPVLTGSEHEILAVNLEVNPCPGSPGRTHWRLGVDYEDVNGDVTSSGTLLFATICSVENPTNCDELEQTPVLSGNGFRGSADSFWCTTFDQFTAFDYAVTIRDAADNESNSVTGRLPRPPGAN